MTTTMYPKVLAFLITASLFGCGGGGSDSSYDPICNQDCAGPVDPIDPIDPVDPVYPEDSIPYSLERYQGVIDASSLQVSDPEGSAGNKVTISELDEYHDEYFYIDGESGDLTFTMQGYSNRSELRILNNFSSASEQYQQRLVASVLPIEPEKSVAASTASKDAFTLLQVHNKGTVISGGTDGIISHPLLRVVWEQSRSVDGTDYSSHYWAVVKTNAYECGEGNEDSYYGKDECDNSYRYFPLTHYTADAATHFEIIVGNSALVLKVNGETKLNYDISYWDALLSYFKAGVYNQFYDGGSEVQFATLQYYENEFIDELETSSWDIDSWKITIPASKDTWYGEGGSSAAELEPEHCDSSKDVLNNDSNIYHDLAELAYFNVIDGRMHFRANMAYGTTTANTNYIRSELRELFNAQSVGSCSTSSNATSWSIVDSDTNSKTHRLSATLRIDDYPTIDGQKPKVVVGQVHGWEVKQALVKLLWEGSDTPVRVILNQDFYKNNEKCGSEEDVIADPNCDEWSFSVDMGTYQAEQEWSYVIQVDEAGISLATEYADGSNKVSRTLPWGEVYSDTNDGSVVISEQWTDPDVAYYFKAGIYPQFTADEDYDGQIFDLSFSQLSISHN
ncbi:polysaccharide lyase family 7 protein [Agarivorans sp. MS3-6]|uniref:polysaccharide lyase family 7 protein n=1 Tax=Agarivorans sp. TSD2052 TaxID=2937286 RepID=UPI00200DACC6|nr:polysaccharide lyase family 7 protein [Agarivorans sp. TSD2052]UPW19522.1 polysaccharide lyase family 7 protein [Agarivorans sp. TSD2052]